MPTSAEAVYVDSSGLVKLVIPEGESAPLRHYLAGRPWRVSCQLASVEVVRAVMPHGAGAIERAQALLRRLVLIRLTDTLLDAASRLGPVSLRSLDAIHLAAAETLGQDLAVLVTYDDRMAAAAGRRGITVEMPGRLR
ncbi:MAG: PIN domain-containing protein [Dehalococcoidia bacterium]|nr:PIN domain-containing protein [Dehalococcoidia bacterium]